MTYFCPDWQLHYFLFSVSSHTHTGFCDSKYPLSSATLRWEDRSVLTGGKCLLKYCIQRWKVTKYVQTSTVLKCKFDIFVLYLGISISGHVMLVLPYIWEVMLRHVIFTLQQMDSVSFGSMLIITLHSHCL